MSIFHIKEWYVTPNYEYLAKDLELLSNFSGKYLHVALLDKISGLIYNKVANKEYKHRSKAFR